ncbi:hypothetical protein ACB092_11G024900 [Castanea dentata]
MKLHNPNFPALLCSTFLHIILLFTLTLLCLKPATSSTTPTNETDRLALLKFKESLDYDPYGILRSWNDSIHFCNWYGVTCGRRHGRVTTLVLEGHNLHGTITPFIGNLTFLRAINLQNNSFYGVIPKEAGHLFRLRHLYLSSNTLGGEIPISLTNCSELRGMILNSNKLIGKIPMELGSMTKLLALMVSGNTLTGGIPPSLGNLSLLVNFSVNYNNLEGNIPESIGHLKSLSFFGVASNKLNGVIPSYFGKFQKMQGLYLSGNKLSGQIPSSIGNLTQLVELNFSQNNLEGSIPPTIGNCQSLQQLDVSQNYLSGVIPLQVFSLFSLSLLLNLSCNSFSGELPVEVGNLKNINSLDISENNLFGKIPTTIGSFLNLEKLYLQGNSFEGIIPSSIAYLKGLQLLDVSRNNLSGFIPKGLEKLLFLKYLNISFNDIEGPLPTVGVFKNLDATSIIGNNKLCGGIPQLQLPKCPKVTKSRNSLASRTIITIFCVVACLLLVSSFLVLYWRKKYTPKPSSIVSKMDLLPTISYKMLHRATNGFSLNNLIGSGAFGSIYKGVLNQEEMLVAVKVINLQTKGATKSFVAECNVLRNVRHRNLVKILTCCSSINNNGDEFKALVFEFMTNGSLEMWLHPMADCENRSKNLSFLQRIIIAIDVASALNYLHNHCQQQIIHCDLKPSNILLDSEMIAHVSDFGLARLLTSVDDSSQKCTSTIGLKGTIGYVAPEYGMGGEASTEGDVYSYGVLVLEMFTGRMPTDDMFKDGLNLHNFVKMALPKRLAQVVDPMLLPREVEELGVATAVMMATEKDDNDNEIEVEEANNIEDSRHIDVDMQKCLLSILNIGILCSLESPKERMSMEEVIKELQLIKSAFISVGIRAEADKIELKDMKQIEEIKCL